MRWWSKVCPFFFSSQTACKELNGSTVDGRMLFAEHHSTQWWWRYAKRPSHEVAWESSIQNSARSKSRLPFRSLQTPHHITCSKSDHSIWGFHPRRSQNLTWVTDKIGYVAKGHAKVGCLHTTLVIPNMATIPYITTIDPHMMAIRLDSDWDSAKKRNGANGRVHGRIIIIPTVEMQEISPVCAVLACTAPSANPNGMLVGAIVAPTPCFT